MKLNIFAGARRIALGFGGLWVIGCLAFALLNDPYVSMTYIIAWPGDSPVRGTACGIEDANKYFKATTSKGNSISVDLCFTAQEAHDGRLLVPFLKAPKPASTNPFDKFDVLMNERYSKIVREYADEVAKRFTIPDGDQKDAERLILDARLNTWKQAIQVMLGGVAILWVIVAGVGWIVRGFMGIRRGQDARSG